MRYRVGIIDDDRTKITQLITYLRHGWKDSQNVLRKEKYKDVSLVPKDLELKNDLSYMVEQVRLVKPDALIIDYKLSSQQSIGYNGVKLAEVIDNALKDFPIFILTSYEDDIYTNECFDVYQIFDFERYMGELEERLEVNSKIVEQIRKYKQTLVNAEEELIQLLPNAGTSVDVDSRILELDTFIENSIDGNSSLSIKQKNDLNCNHLQRLIEKIDSIIEN